MMNALAGMKKDDAPAVEPCVMFDVSKKETHHPSQGYKKLHKHLRGMNPPVKVTMYVLSPRRLSRTPLRTASHARPPRAPGSAYRAWSGTFPSLGVLWPRSGAHDPYRSCPFRHLLTSPRCLFLPPFVAFFWSPTATRRS